MTSFLTLGLVDTKEYPMVELIKKKLAGATSIRRAVSQGQPNIEALHDQPQTAIDPGASFGGVAGGVVCDDSSHPAATAAIRDYEHIGAQQKINIFENTPCTENKLLKNLEAIVEAIEELKSSRGVIPSNKVGKTCTPTVAVRRKRRKIRKILSVLKLEKIATPSAPRVIEVQGPPKKVDIIAVLGKEKNKELEEFIKRKVQKRIHHAFICRQRLHEYDKYVCVVQGQLC
ncbi:hypothetical protein P3S68_031458 [Capsicum galapagoense]